MFESYSSEGLIKDDTEVLDTVGRYAAEVYKALQVVVVNQAVIPGSKFRLRTPVVFELDNGIWRVADKIK
jgi:hypothetical protein